MLAGDHTYADATAAFLTHELGGWQTGMFSYEGIQRNVSWQTRQVHCVGACRNESIKAYCEILNSYHVFMSCALTGVLLAINAKTAYHCHDSAFFNNYIIQQIKNSQSSVQATEKTFMRHHKFQANV